MKQPDAAKQSAAAVAVVNAPPSDYAPYPKIDPTDVAPVAEETWTTVPMAAPSPPPLPEHPTVKSPEHAPKQNSAPLDLGSASEPPAAVAARDSATTMPPMDSNPYVSPSPVPAPASSAKKTMESVKDVLGKLGKRASEATKKVEVYAGDMWQHLRTGPSFADAAVGRIAQGTKVIAEGGYEKIFRQTFVVVPEEQLLKTYACYLSTSAGPVMGVLYLSSAKLAFCSDNPLSYKVGEETQWSHYKVAIPLHQLKAVNPSTSKVNPSEKFIQVVSVDDHEFWFMGFVNYESAVKNLQGAFQPHGP